MQNFQKKKEIINENNLFYFKGTLTHPNAKKIYDKTDEIVGNISGESGWPRRCASNVIVNLFQEALKLRESVEKRIPPKVLFKMAFYKDLFYIYFRRVDDFKNINHYINQIERVNNLDEGEQKSLMKDLLSSSPFSVRTNPLALLDVLEIRRESQNKILYHTKVKETGKTRIEIIVHVPLISPRKSKINELVLPVEQRDEVLQWHIDSDNELSNQLVPVIEELKFHQELKPEKIVNLLTNEEFLRTFEIRKHGLQTIPDEWINQRILKIDYEKLDELWMRPSKGYLHKILSNAHDENYTERLHKLERSNAFAYRAVDTKLEERTNKRLQKLQKSIENNQVVLFLGRQNRVYKHLQDKLNERYKGEVEFISDHVWSARGYIEPGVKSSDSRLSVLQAVETIRRMPDLELKGDAIKKRTIAFSLDGYDEKVAFAAMYSNPNRIERNYPRPKIEGLNDFKFSYTGLTDLELANIVRNKEWFDFMIFYRTGKNGEPEELNKDQVAEEYGIKYIGDLMETILKNKTENNK